MKRHAFFGQQAADEVEIRFEVLDTQAVHAKLLADVPLPVGLRVVGEDLKDARGDAQRSVYGSPIGQHQVDEVAVAECNLETVCRHLEQIEPFGFAADIVELHRDSNRNIRWQLFPKPRAFIRAAAKCNFGRFVYITFIIDEARVLC